MDYLETAGKNTVLKDLRKSQMLAQLDDPDYVETNTTAEPNYQLDLDV